jgi:hypothetical protein
MGRTLSSGGLTPDTSSSNSLNVNALSSKLNALQHTVSTANLLAETTAAETAAEKQSALDIGSSFLTGLQSWSQRWKRDKRMCTAITYL